MDKTKRLVPPSFVQIHLSFEHSTLFLPRGLYMCTNSGILSRFILASCFNYVLTLHFYQLTLYMRSYSLVSSFQMRSLLVQPFTLLGNLIFCGLYLTFLFHNPGSAVRICSATAIVLYSLLFVSFLVFVL